MPHLTKSFYACVLGILDAYLRVAFPVWPAVLILLNTSGYNNVNRVSTHITCLTRRSTGAERLDLALTGSSSASRRNQISLLA